MDEEDTVMEEANAETLELRRVLTDGYLNLLEYRKTLYKENVNFLDVTDSGDTFLHTAVKNSFCTGEVVQELLHRGVNALHLNEKDRTALHEACRTDHCSVDIIRPLLEYRVRCTTKDLYGNTALHYFMKSQSSCIEVMGELILFGANVNTRNDKRETPLHVSTKRLITNVNMIKELLRRGADPRLMDRNECTPLHNFVAMPWCKEFPLKELIDHGADVNALSKLEKTPLHLALVKPYFDVEIVHELLRNGADPNAADFSGDTALHLVMHNAFTSATFVNGKVWKFYKVEKIIDLLLEYHAEIDAKNKSGMTPLHFVCAKYDNADIAIALLNKLLVKGANINAQASNRYTPLHYAVKQTRVSYSFIVEVLKSGADLGAQDVSNMTPLVLFCYKLCDKKTHEVVKVFHELLHATMSCDMPTFHIDSIFKSISRVKHYALQKLFYTLLVKFYTAFGQKDGRSLCEKINIYCPEILPYRKSCVAEMNRMYRYRLCNCNAYPICCEQYYPCCKGMPMTELLVYNVASKKSYYWGLAEQVFTSACTNFRIYCEELCHSVPMKAVMLAFLKRGISVRKRDKTRVCLPDDCVKIVASFLSKADMVNFIQALEMKHSHKCSGLYDASYRKVKRIKSEY